MEVSDEFAERLAKQLLQQLLTTTYVSADVYDGKVYITLDIGEVSTTVSVPHKELPLDDGRLDWFCERMEEVIRGSLQ